MVFFLGGGEVFAADGGVVAGGGFEVGEGEGELGLKGDAFEAELAEFFAHNEEVAHVHPAGFKGGGHFFDRLGDGGEGLGIEGREAGSEQGDPAQGGGEGVFDHEFRGPQARTGFVTAGRAFFDGAFLLIPDREWNRHGETEELVCAKALGFVRVLVVGVLNAEADAFPSLCASECDFESGLFFLKGEEIDIGTVDGFWRRWRSDVLDGALECSGEFDGVVRAEA